MTETTEQTPESVFPPLSPRRFTIALAVILGCFLMLEVAYAFLLPRVMDEFTGARYDYLVTRLVPYRDFKPAKTVLTYYVQAPPIALIDGHWDAMTGVRIELVILWAAALAFGAVSIAREIEPPAVAAALAMTAVMSTFAERAMEVRSDAVAAIFGFASLAALVRRRPALAGILCAASFCSTQKGIYFALAGGFALVATMLRDRTRESLVDAVKFGGVAALSVAAYFGFWAIIASPGAIVDRVLLDQNIRNTAITDVYRGLHARFWGQTLRRNPLFYGLALLGLIRLVPLWLKGNARADIVVPYAVALLPLCIWHKQPWPYFFVFLVPTLFAVIAVALGQLRWNEPLVRTAVAAAVLLPLARLPVTLTNDLTAYQKAMVDAGEKLLAPADTYVDGTNMLFRHGQAAPELVWVDAAMLDALARSSEADIASLVARIDRAHPKLVIWSYRIADMPPLMRGWVRSRFVPLYGDLLMYGPAISAPRFGVAFDGEYRIDVPAVIDGVPVHGVVNLRRGAHTLAGVERARLALLPPAGLEVDARYAAPRPLFDRVYDY